MITIRESKVSVDDGGLICLTDLWKLSGEPVWKNPPKWIKRDYVRELIAALGRSNIPHGDVWEPIKSKPGNRGGTYAHPILALAYAEYLNPDLGIEVREIALRVYAGDVTVLDEFNRAHQERLNEDVNRIMAREEIRKNNTELNATLKTVGATHSTQWASFHNEGYKGLYDGLNEDMIHARKDLERNQKILDHMGSYELAANMFRTFTAQQHLKEHPVAGVKRACEIHHRMGQSVRAYLAEYNLTMPEDLPKADSIKDAQRRLKQLK